MKKPFRFLLCAFAALTVYSAATAFAATSFPSSADAARAQNQITPMQSPNTPDISGTAANVAPVNAPKGAEKVKFVLKSVTLEGATVYPETEIKSFYADMIGQKISLADVYSLAQKLTAKYRNDGYILTQVVIPPQTIDGGHIKLRAVEGFVDQVSVQGGEKSDSAFLRSFADKIKASKPLNAKTLERYILLMNDMAGISARAVLSPSQHTTGASDVTIIVSQKPYDLFFQVDNRGSRYLGPLQANAGARLNNALGLGEGINFQVVSAPDGFPHRELDYVGLSWSQPIDHEGTVLNVGGSVTSTQPGYTLATFDVHGLAHSYNISLSHPFIRSRTKNFYGSLKFDYLNSTRNDNLGLGTTEDRLRVLRLGSTFQSTDRFLGINTITGELSKGLNVLGASDKGDANMTRALGDPKFLKGTLQISRVQRLTDMFEVYGGASGQWSADTLLASEEFGVGGVNFGSAYDSSEITGEDGLAGRVELRANNPVNTPANLVQLYGFYDIGKVWDWDNAVVKDRQRSIASTGLGARVNVNENFAGTAEVAFPLTREVQTMGNKNPRFFGAITAKF